MSKKAFTLVELIVVITILAILGTIAFLSFQGYTKSARDSIRINDLKLIEKNLGLYKIETGEYPLPSDPDQVEYESKEVWIQGTIGQSVITNLDKLNKVPRDPLTGNEYTYSRLNTKKELQLACILEGSPVTLIKNEEIKTLFSVIPAEAGIYKNNFIPQANAADVKTTATAYVIGDYNGQIAKVNSGSTTYVLAVPTIINGDMTLTDIISIISNKKLVYNGYGNLPASYTGTIFEMNGGFDYSQTGGIIVYSGSISDLKTDEDARIELISNLQGVYSGTILKNTGNIKKLLETDIDTDTPSDDAKILACGTVDFGLGIGTVASGCESNNSSSDSCILTNDDVNTLNNLWSENEIRLMSFFGEFSTGSPVSRNAWCNDINNIFDFTWRGGQSIAPEIFKLKGLKYMKLSDNGLSSLPSEISNLTDLIYLDLSDNSLSSFPNEIGNLTNLIYLDLSNNSLSSLDPEIGNLINLETLYLDQNSLSSLPNEIGSLNRLEDIYLEHNLFTNIPVPLTNLGNLKSLLIRNNSISEINPEIGDITNLEYLYLSSNPITSCSPDISKLTNLKNLYLADISNTGYIPDEIWSITSLETLNLNLNFISTLSGGIKNLQNLKTLDLYENSLSSLPVEIGDLISLETLEAANNSITSLPNEIGDLNNLKLLQLFDNSLVTLPNTIGNLTSLDRLEIYNNSITSLPSEIGNLTNLKKLKLHNNSLTWLPDEIGDLNSLTDLHLTNNNLTSIPNTIGNLVNLKNLYLSNNSLSSIPDEIGDLNNLEDLNLQYNTLNSLPENLTNLNKLENLNLWSNTSLGELNSNFMRLNSNKSQSGIPEAGKTMTIGGNGTNVVITVTP